MALRNNLRYRLAQIARKMRMWILHREGYVNISSYSVIEHNVGLDKINRKGIHIGSGCLIASGSVILSHEHIFVKPDGSYYYKDTYIGKNCFIGVRTIICPGVHIGNQVVIGAGSVVSKDIPDNCIAVGVPARVIKTGIQMNDQARLVGEFSFKE